MPFWPLTGAGPGDVENCHPERSRGIPRRPQGCVFGIRCSAGQTANELSRKIDRSIDRYGPAVNNEIRLSLFHTALDRFTRSANWLAIGNNERSIGIRYVLRRALGITRTRQLPHRIALRNWSVFG